MTLAARGVIAFAGTCVIFAWVVFDLDVFWLGLGSGLVTGHLLVWVAGSRRPRIPEKQLSRLLWILFAVLAVSFLLLRDAFLTFCAFGALLAVEIHYFSFHAKRIWKLHSDDQRD